MSRCPETEGTGSVHNLDTHPAQCCSPPSLTPAQDFPSPREWRQAFMGLGRCATQASRCLVAGACCRPMGHRMGSGGPRGALPGVPSRAAGKPPATGAPEAPPVLEEGVADAAFIPSSSKSPARRTALTRGSGCRAQGVPRPLPPALPCPPTGAPRGRRSQGRSVLHGVSPQLYEAGTLHEARTLWGRAVGKGAMASGPPPSPAQPGPLRPPDLHPEPRAQPGVLCPVGEMNLPGDTRWP